VDDRGPTAATLPMDSVLKGGPFVLFEVMVLR